MEPRAAVLALALLSLAGFQAAPAGKGDVSRVQQLETAVDNLIEEVMQVTHDTDEWLKVSELVRELELQAKDLSDQLGLELSPKVQRVLEKAIRSTMRLVVAALEAMEPYLAPAMEQTEQALNQALEQVLEQMEALGLDLPGALQAGAKWVLELKEQLVGPLPSPSS